MKYKNGDEYAGDFEDDQKTGYALLKLKDGAEY